MQEYVYKKRTTFIPFGCTIQIMGNRLVDFIELGKTNHGYLNKLGSTSCEIVFNEKKEYPTIKQYLENAIVFCVEFKGEPINRYISATLKKLKEDANTSICEFTTDIWLNFARKANRKEQLFLKSVLMPFACRRVFRSKYVNLITMGN